MRRLNIILAGLLASCSTQPATAFALACDLGKVSIGLVVCCLASRAIAKPTHECCGARSIRDSLAPSGLETACPAWTVFRAFTAVSYVTGAPVSCDEAYLNRLPKADAMVLNLWLLAT